MLKSCWSSFSNHFINISKCFDKMCCLKENYTLCSYPFWGTVKWNSNHNIQSFVFSFELPFHLQIELAANLLNQNVNVLENEPMYACHHTPYYNHSWILNIHKARILSKSPLNVSVWPSKSGFKIYKPLVNCRKPCQSIDQYQWSVIAA